LRIIFLGFVQKKGWLNNDIKSIEDYISLYNPCIHIKGIYRDLLEPLFFKILNFPCIDLDAKELYITNEGIINFIDFLFNYNFNLEENTLYDEGLELNPEFLSIIFERLIDK
jgi:hypothetical protein